MQMPAEDIDAGGERAAAFYTIIRTARLRA